MCKFFVLVIEDGKYGWFWICLNGGDKCMYKYVFFLGLVYLIFFRDCDYINKEVVLFLKLKNKE